eukprot:jgi/Botrbrau1/5597/Bobra.97_2s0023.1
MCAGKRYQVSIQKTSEEADALHAAKKWYAETTEEWTKVRKTYGILDYLQVLIPAVGWLRTYQLKSYLLPDLVAGFSVAALVVPQGMSYARLAGLPPVFGLYGAFVPVVCYAALGFFPTSGCWTRGCDIITAGSGLPNVVDVPIQDDPNKPEDPHAQQVYNMAAIEVAFLAGVLYTAVGLLNLGWLMNFLSHSVIQGFMTGASVIISLSQFKFFMGYNRRPNPLGKNYPQISFPRNDPREPTAGRPVWQGVDPEIGKRYPKLVYVRAVGPLTVCVISIIMTYAARLDKKPHNIRITGAIPRGLPTETISWWFPMDNFAEKLGLAVLVCAIDVLESISIAKALAFKNSYELNFTQELRGLGLANVVGSMFNCYTTTGSFSRSAVMDTVGARTQLAGVASGLVNAMAAITSPPSLASSNYTEWWHLWKVNKLDWVVFTVAMLGTMFAGVDRGLGISIAVSLLLALYKYAFPHTAVLGHLPGSGGVYRNVKQYPDAKQVDGLLVVRIDAPLFFANVPKVKDDLYQYERRAEAAHKSRGSQLKYLIVDLSPVTDIDASAVHWLVDFVKQLQRRGHHDRSGQPLQNCDKAAGPRQPAGPHRA